MLRTVQATRYVTPLREGGSLPALVEADDLGLYVVKFRGAGQGPLALVAEMLGGEIGRQLGINVPELVFVDVDSALGRNEPDQEVQDLLRASQGINLGLDYLPGSVMFDPAAKDSAPLELASRAVWFDAFISNVDRTARNPNLLCWHNHLHFIDHGAALYFHHSWNGGGQPDLPRLAGNGFSAIRQHVLMPWASKIAQAEKDLRSRLTEDFISTLLEEVPDDWLCIGGVDLTPGQQRQQYCEYFRQRLNSTAFVEEALRVQSELF